MPSSVDFLVNIFEHNSDEISTSHTIGLHITLKNANKPLSFKTILTGYLLANVLGSKRLNIAKKYVVTNIIIIAAIISLITTGMLGRWLKST